MEDRVMASMLLDIYEELLTEKQKDIMNLYYDDDLSLSEISEITHTSRQASYDIIKRCNKLLLDYESKLGLLKRENELKKIRIALFEKIGTIKKDINDPCLVSQVEEIEKLIIENV